MLNFPGGRSVVVDKELNPEECKRIRESLLSLSLKSDSRPITIWFDASGGEVEPTALLYQFIRLLKPPLIGIVAANCNSMAVLLLQACDIRLAIDPSCLIKMHRGRIEISFDSSSRSIKRAKKIISLSDRKIARLIAKRAGCKTRAILRLDGKEAELEAPEALKVGLLDGYLVAGQLNRVVVKAKRRRGKRRRGKRRRGKDHKTVSLKRLIKRISR